VPPLQRSHWLPGLEGVFGFTPSLNHGALFGFGQGYGAVFVALSLVAIMGILLWMFYFDGIHSLLITIALGCTLAGVLGNLYDRLALHGIHRGETAVYAVRDWIDFRLINWPIFNIADSFLVCGAALLLWHAYITPEPTTPDEQSASEPTSDDASSGKSKFQG
ncbi:MAG: signal peptidase II, partial [Planctomycetales bacterium]